MAEASEVKRSKSHAPRSVQPIAVLETLQELTCRLAFYEKKTARRVKTIIFFM